MKVENNTVVAISYNLSVSSKENPEPQLIESTEPGSHFYFLFGSSGLPEKFEKDLIGKNEGETFKINLNKDEAYGDADPEAIVDLPKSAFSINGKVDETMLKPGNYLPMKDPEGYPIQGKILEVTADAVVMDFNHPLAGKDLSIEGKVEKIRTATAEEINHGHVHGEGGHHH
jgi:FKBP-type peptidyl-prolyl cis-trans isomerase SlyD